MRKRKVVKEEFGMRTFEFKNKNHSASGKPVDLEIRVGVGILVDSETGDLWPLFDRCW